MWQRLYVHKMTVIFTRFPNTHCRTMTADLSYLGSVYSFGHHTCASGRSCLDTAFAPYSFAMDEPIEFAHFSSCLPDQTLPIDAPLRIQYDIHRRILGTIVLAPIDNMFRYGRGNPKFRGHAPIPEPWLGRSRTTKPESNPSGFGSL